MGRENANKRRDKREVRHVKKETKIAKEVRNRIADHFVSPRPFVGQVPAGPFFPP